jgi:hypothetical protein
VVVVVEHTISQHQSPLAAVAVVAPVETQHLHLHSLEHRERVLLEEAAAVAQEQEEVRRAAQAALVS